MVGVIIAYYIGTHFISKKRHKTGNTSFRSQLISGVVPIFGVFALILVIPIGDTLRQQLLSLLGIMLSAAIALSSATFVGNVMAGFMLRAIRNFKSGDFIQVADYFGRVSDRGLFHVELQTIDRDLITLPNLFVMQNAVRATRSSGTFVTADLSIGFDVPHQHVHEILIKAAEMTALTDAFTQILNIGDYSVEYRVSGFLTEVNHYITKQSELRGNIIDEFHKQRIEIVSPQFVNRRTLSANEAVVAGVEPTENRPESREAEESEKKAFDKAEMAQSIEELKQKLHETVVRIEEKKEHLKSSADKASAKLELSLLEKQSERYRQLIAVHEHSASEEKET